ncbi:MAG: radical SAM protein [Clostridia bacterium]|nr:radical SAM protein [Clostridia bacterium]
MKNIKFLEECRLCPRNCKVNRLNGEMGFCKAGSNIKIAKACLHFFEEPCISGIFGSGTIFFTGCNLRCKFCQNYKISQEGLGKEITIEELANKMIELQNQGANNINLVTGFMYIPQIIEALKIAKSNGLNIPIVYNSSGYENIDSLKLLENYVDIYLPDFKYYYEELAVSISNASNYFEIAKEVIKEMIRQAPKNIYDEDKMLKKGIIIRHLVLPNHIQNSKQVLKWIKNNLSKDINVSIMAQYFPSYKASEISDINRKLTQEEFEDIENFVYSLNLKNGYIQYLEENEEKYVPDFDLDS